MFGSLSVPVFPGKSDAKDKVASRQVILQPLLNSVIELKLMSQGWLAQPEVKARLDATKTRYFADFYKEGRTESVVSLMGDAAAALQVLMEVQFANSARTDSDLKKFLIGFSQGRCDVGVLVVPEKAMACCMSSNVANYEYVVDGLKELGPLMVPVPMFVIGLTEEDAQRIDLSQSKFTHPKQITGARSKKDRVGAAWCLVNDLPVAGIGPGFEPPVNPELLQDIDDEDASEGCDELDD